MDGAYGHGSMSTAVLIMAGGTGGHVFPALAVAELLREREYQVVWMGTRRGLEARLVPARGFPIEWLSVSGLRGKGLLAWLLAPVHLTIALAQAFSIVRRRKPAVVLGVGGFATGPGGVAAWLLGRPLVIHEQNAIAGLTNRWLARIARVVLEGFPGGFASGVNARCIGNPVRREIVALPAPESRFAVRSGAVRLLIIGGSLGARRLNSGVPRALALLQRQGHRFEVWHQAGERGIEEARAEYSLAGVTGRVDAFIDDMASAYGWADLVICRSGALTVAELAAAGIGSLLVPFPHAVDDHQTHNARFLTEAGAAALVPDQDFEPARVAAELSLLTADRLQLLEMARRARTRAMPHAAESLTRAVIELAGQAS
jgi:UDP-N-acetylglucosamine--N-acetylmuramyl-(pentapeptide) pyrophosphoryl-undecaprenol N-acetylglucosamine transferase